MVHLSHPYMATGKTIALTIWIFVGKVMSLLFNMLYRLVIVFFPWSKCFLISWLQSLSAVILEPKKIKSVSSPPSIWMGMGKFNSDDCLLLWTRIPCPQGISLMETYASVWDLWSSLHSQQKSLKCTTWVQFQKQQNDLFVSQTALYIIAQNWKQPKCSSIHKQIVMCPVREDYTTIFKTKYWYMYLYEWVSQKLCGAKYACKKTILLCWELKKPMQLQRNGKGDKKVSWCG